MALFIFKLIIFLAFVSVNKILRKQLDIRVARVPISDVIELYGSVEKALYGNAHLTFEVGIRINIKKKT